MHQSCATRVFFVLIILLRLLWPIEPKCSQVCYFLHTLGFTRWEYWSLTFAKRVQCLQEPIISQQYFPSSSQTSSNLNFFSLQCSETCGQGTRVRMASCIRDGIEAPGMCEDSNKPLIQESCTVQDCPSIGMPPQFTTPFHKPEGNDGLAGATLPPEDRAAASLLYLNKIIIIVTLVSTFLIIWGLQNPHNKWETFVIFGWQQT